MYRWMDGWTNGRTEGGGSDGRTLGWTGGRQVERGRKGWLEVWRKGLDGWMDFGTDERTYRGGREGVDEWMDRWKKGAGGREGQREGGGS